MLSWSKAKILWVAVGLVALGCLGTVAHWWSSGATPPAPAPPAPPPLSEVWRPLEPPAGPEVPGLKLPKPMEISASRRFIPVSADCKTRVRWLVSSQVRTAPVEVLESPLTNSVLILPAGNQEDLVTIVAYTVANGQPSDPATTFIKVTPATPTPTPGPAPTPTPTPTPGPSPVPTPEPSVQTVHVTFVLDYTHQTKAVADIINDKGLRQFLKDGDNEVHELSIKADLKSLDLQDTLANLKAPILLLQAKSGTGVKNGQVLLAAPLTSAQQVKDAVNKLTGKAAPPP